MARTSKGLINRAHKRSRASGASELAEAVTDEEMEDKGEEEEEEEQGEQKANEEVLCVTVDGKGHLPDSFITLAMIYEPTETEVPIAAPLNEERPAPLIMLPNVSSDDIAMHLLQYINACARESRQECFPSDCGHLYCQVGHDCYLHGQVALRTHPSTTLARLFEVFCNTLGANLSEVKFMCQGERLSGSNTCRHLSNVDEPILVSKVDC